MNGMTVRAISGKETHDLLLNVHYARRLPPISYAFGLFDGASLEGVVTFGSPAGAPVRSGLAGPEFADRVLELNRLCLRHNRPNEASFLVSKALKLLGGDRLVISYADTAQGHTGCVYQATNALYLGLSAKRTDWAVRGKEGKHGQSVADEFRGVPDRVKAMRAKYGDDFYLRPRPRKHRYLYILGSRAFKKAAKAAVRYAQEPYPKAHA